ncbi:DUF2812 domain-containing protein [Cytobacillus sp. FSL W7-1323]|uniref:DUF2812 domain-containing protein n=1 Tax=Cytobacillus kochii TaxID=859143 RepID=A0A248TNL3_9BACI|nr:MULTISPECIES: DUF2812 domain-containing protein [Cytobacillus]ASV69752.1 hypothetical protein CKF48_22050 [Cytobacillus kochii]MEA1852244.1 DUF2812 domain-containing protein [Cytobacillus sp. OWB-43]
MRKFKVFIDFDKEEQWLERMASEGYQLESTYFGYKFRLVEAKEKKIKIDFRKFKHSADFLDYITLFEDSGWRHIAGSKYSGIQYFEKIDDQATDDIFSDNVSKAKRYKRYAHSSLMLAIGNFPLIVFLYYTGIIDPAYFIRPSELYLTPGLWDKSGMSFWFSFIFETPFALLRGAAWTFIPLSVLSYLFFSYKANKRYIQSMIKK